MKFFVDTADTAEIKSLAAGGLLGGVTTNPSLVAKTGKKFTDIIREIRDILPGPVSASDYDGMMREALAPREPAGNVTMPPPVSRSLFNHPPTDKGLAASLAGWSRTGQTIA